MIHFSNELTHQIAQNVFNVKKSVSLVIQYTT